MPFNPENEAQFSPNYKLRMDSSRENGSKYHLILDPKMSDGSREVKYQLCKDHHHPWFKK